MFLKFVFVSENRYAKAVVLKLWERPLEGPGPTADTVFTVQLCPADGANLTALKTPSMTTV